MGCVKTLIILPMASLYLSVVTGRKGPDDFMPYSMSFQVFLEESRLIPVRSKAVGKFRSIIGLDALDGERERFYQVLHKLCGGIGAVFLKSFHKTPSGILVNGSVLEELLSNDPAVFETGGRDKFDIHLDTLARILHLLIWLWDVFGIGWMDRHNALLFQEAVESGDGAGITALPEFHPKNDQTGIRITAAHLKDEPCFLRGMLVRVMVRASGAITQGFYGAVKASFPAIDILAVCFVFNGSSGNAILLSVTDQG